MNIVKTSDPIRPARADGLNERVHLIPLGHEMAGVVEWVGPEVGGVAVDTQIIKNGEYLTEPQAPEKADHRFVGWFAGEEKLSFP